MKKEYKVLYLLYALMIGFAITVTWLTIGLNAVLMCIAMLMAGGVIGWIETERIMRRDHVFADELEDEAEEH